jgi:hypothetical protein
LQGRYEDKIETISRRRDAATTDAERQAADDELAEFLLSAMPFVRQINAPDEPAEPDVPVSRGVVRVKKRHNKKDLMHEFMYHAEGIVNNDVIRVVGRVDTVYDCDCGGRLLQDVTQAMETCEACGRTYIMQDISAGALSHNEITTQTTFSNHMAYKRLNHFCEWLATMQAREGTDIPPDIIEAVRYEFKKARVTDPKDITPERVREYLKKLRLNQYYENTNAICRTLSGRQAPQISPELEATLKKMFVNIEKPWQVAKPPERKNFLSYSFVLYKFLELLGEDDYLGGLYMLKSNARLHKQDIIWEKICQQLNWQFIPTI